MTLVHKDTRRPVRVGDKVTDFRGKAAVVTGWMEPRHSGSTGRVTVKDALGEFYPSVFNLEWTEAGS